jgi:hypothetical protein
MKVHRHTFGHDNAIGSWNPAWGPKPKWRKAQPPPRERPDRPHHYCERWIGCLAPCVNAEPVLIHCPRDEAFRETYACSICGREMWQSDASP